MKPPERGGGYSCAMRAEPVITVDEPGWGGDEPRYRPIESYGLIGDLRTAALRRPATVRSTGSAPGASTGRASSRRSSTPTSAAASASRPRSRAPASSSTCPTPPPLLTRFFSGGGVAEVTDFMPLGARALRAGAPGLRGARRGRLPHVVPAGLRLRPRWTHRVDLSAPRPRALHGAGRLGATELASSLPMEPRRPAAAARFTLRGRRGRLVRPAARRLRASAGRDDAVARASSRPTATGAAG